LEVVGSKRIDMSEFEYSKRISMLLTPLRSLVSLSSTSLASLPRKTTSALVNIANLFFQVFARIYHLVSDGQRIVLRKAIMDMKLAAGNADHPILLRIVLAFFEAAGAESARSDTDHALIKTKSTSRGRNSSPSIATSTQSNQYDVSSEYIFTFCP